MKKSRYPTNPLFTRIREFRSQPTPAENLLWQTLRNRQLGGYKFRRQHRIDHFVVDFYCFETKLIVEVDGDIHKAQADYDLARSKHLEDLGFALIRFNNKQIIKKLHTVKELILKACQERGGTN